MKRFVSAWNMLRSKNAFTLIEVMVAVLIISVVIMALLEMQGNSAHMFSRFSSQLKINQYASFFISNEKYGFEKESVNLDDLLSDFKLEDDLRRDLKNIKVKLVYEKSEQLDMSESDDENVSSGMIFEIGRTILNINDSSTALVRFRIQ